MTPQVLAVQARLVQDHPDVQAVAILTGNWSAVNRLTAASIYIACGRDLRRCRKVLDRARCDLRNMRRNGEHREKLYQEQLMHRCLSIAKRTTAPAARKQRKPQPMRPS